jgi:hypothetical protein
VFGFSGNMSQKKKVLHAKLKPKRPSEKCGHFVSYSAGGLRQQEQKYGGIAKPRKLISTRRDIWTTYYRNGRPKFVKNCVILYHVVFDSRDTVQQQWEASYSHLPGRHAEVQVLQHIKAWELCYRSHCR